MTPQRRAGEKPQTKPARYETVAGDVDVCRSINDNQLTGFVPPHSQVVIVIAQTTKSIDFVGSSTGTKRQNLLDLSFAPMLRPVVQPDLCDQFPTEVARVPLARSCLRDILSR